MSTPNRTLLEKLDMAVSDLIADGGYLLPEQAQSFIKKTIKASDILSAVDVRTLKSYDQNIDRVGITGQVLKPGTTGVALPLADRSKPTTEQSVLHTHLMRGAIDLTDELLEDSIEGGTFANTVQDLMAEHVALDLADVTINGNTATGTGIFALYNGVIAAATLHTAAAGGVALNPTALKNLVKAMPVQYDRLRGQQEIWTSPNAEIDYRDVVGARATALGDANLNGAWAPLMPQGRKLMAKSVFPETLGIGTETVCILTHPKNIRVGFWRQVQLEKERIASEGKTRLHVSVRVGFSFVEPDAVAKLTGVVVA
jgi:hypothetical protein